MGRGRHVEDARPLNDSFYAGIKPVMGYQGIVHGQRATLDARRRIISLAEACQRGQRGQIGG